jgi:predicted transcriptional regulator
VKNYANPLCAINHSRYSIFVTKTEDKVCVKTFNYYRQRGVGKKYFKIQTLVQYVTYNFKTNSLYNGSITNYHLKRKFRKKINRNSFNQDPINRMKSLINSELSNILGRNPELSINKTNIIERPKLFYCSRVGIQSVKHVM